MDFNNVISVPGRLHPTLGGFAALHRPNMISRMLWQRCFEAVGIESCSRLQYRAVTGYRTDLARGER